MNNHNYRKLSRIYKRILLKKALFVLAPFLLGWFAHFAYTNFSPAILDKQLPLPFIGGNEKPSPGDWIKENQIKVYQNEILLKIPNATFAKYADTNSMDPLLDEQTNGIEISPVREQLKVGDVISYSSNRVDATLVHRITAVEQDKFGTYYIVQGDNNAFSDPEKVRFEQIEGVLVAVVY